MFRHQLGESHCTASVPAVFVLSQSEIQLFIEDNSDVTTPLRILNTNPDKELNSVQRKDKIRYCKLSKDTDFNNLQDNVLIYTTDDTQAWQVTHQLRLTQGYKYLPRSTKFGLLCSLIDEFKVRSNSSEKLVQLSRISETTKYESSHVLGGLPIAHSKYIESVALSYLLLSEKQLRIDSCTIDIKVNAHRIIDTELLTFSEADTPLDYLHIPLFNGVESLVIRIPRCQNLAEACERYGCHTEPFDQVDDDNYYVDYSNSFLYSVNNKDGKSYIHRNLKDECFSKCSSKLCPKTDELAPVLDALGIAEIESKFLLEESKIISSTHKQEPKPQRVKLNAPITPSNLDSDLKIEDFVGLDNDVWATFGMKLGIIRQLPLNETALADVLLRAAVLDMTN